MKTEINDANTGENPSSKLKQNLILTAKDSAYIAVFVATTIALQFALTYLPGIELVTVMFIAFSYACGIKKAVISATTFSIFRQIIFGVFPNVLILYLVYYNLIAVLFGLLGRKKEFSFKRLIILTICACICTITFTLLDNVITPLWLGYSKKVAKLYFYSSFAFALPQTIFTAISVALLFTPLYKVFIKLNTK